MPSPAAGPAATSLICIGWQRTLDWSSCWDLFETKYASSNYSMMHILKALSYFRDAEKDPMPDMLMDCSWDEVKRFFLKETTSSA